jgi:FAD:protein FMN transferase
MTNNAIGAVGGLLLAGLLLPAAPGRAGKQGEGKDTPRLSRHTFTEPHMGTRFKVIVYAPDESVANRAAKAAFARIARLDGIMSDYRTTSELMRLCAKAGGAPVKVSEELFIVLARGQDLAEKTGGAFDATVGPVTRLWRIARKGQRLPDPDGLKAALALVGHNRMILDPKERTVQLKKAGMRLDLGGIAKGYAADEALKVLKTHGLSRGLVAAGGDIAVGDAPPGEKGWTVGIAPLADPEAKPGRYLLLTNAAVSTSGDAEQYVEIGGKRYSHIVDPRTGIGVLGQFSVTVTARRGITTDSLATAVAVMGPDRGMKLVRGMKGVEALFVRKTEKGEEVLRTPGFKEKERKR